MNNQSPPLSGECIKIINMEYSITKQQTTVRQVLSDVYEDINWAYLAQNYSDPELSLTDLCHYLGFSCSYFSTLFKQKTGLNYSHYITSLRLEQAARLLTDTDDTALSIGYQVGYSAPNYFSRAFKKFYGISPSRYRKQNRIPTV